MIVSVSGRWLRVMTACLAACRQQTEEQNGRLREASRDMTHWIQATLAGVRPSDGRLRCPA